MGDRGERVRRPNPAPTWCSSRRGYLACVGYPGFARLALEQDRYSFNDALYRISGNAIWIFEARWHIQSGFRVLPCHC